jgi:plastocyanin
MKNKILLLSLLLTASISGFSLTWTVNNSGNTFTPASITISLGDSVNFSIASNHNAVEVNQATWNSNGNTPLSTGFSTTFGGGLVLPGKLTAGIHYYVCQPHASMGMKGTIIVVDFTGIDEVLAKVSIDIFPIPASDMIYISADNDLTGTAFSINNISGQQMMSGMLDRESPKIDISTFPEGVYFFILTDSRKKAIRFIKN